MRCGARCGLVVIKTLKWRPYRKCHRHQKFKALGCSIELNTVASLLNKGFSLVICPCYKLVPELLNIFLQKGRFVKEECKLYVKRHKYISQFQVGSPLTFKGNLTKIEACPLCIQPSSLSSTGPEMGSRLTFQGAV